MPSRLETDQDGTASFRGVEGVGYALVAVVTDPPTERVRFSEATVVPAGKEPVSIQLLLGDFDDPGNVSCAWDTENEALIEEESQYCAVASAAP